MTALAVLPAAVAPQPAATANFAYDCPVLGATTTRSRHRQCRHGSRRAFQYSIDQSNVRTTVMVPRRRTWPSNASLLGAEEGRIVLSAVASARLHDRRAAGRRHHCSPSLLGLGAPGDGNYPAEREARAAQRELLLRASRRRAPKRSAATCRPNSSSPTRPGRRRQLANGLTPGVNGGNWVVRAAARRRASLHAGRGEIRREGEGSSAGARCRSPRRRSAPAVFDGRIPFNGFGGTADGASYTIDITNRAGGRLRRRAAARPLPPHHGLPGRPDPCLRPGRAGWQTAVRAERLAAAASSAASS